VSTADFGRKRYIRITGFGEHSDRPIEMTAGLDSNGSGVALHDVNSATEEVGTPSLGRPRYNLSSSSGAKSRVFDETKPIIAGSDVL
jgi:hypothetical protein